MQLPLQNPHKYVAAFAVFNKKGCRELMGWGSPLGRGGLMIIHQSAVDRECDFTEVQGKIPSVLG